MKALVKFAVGNGREGMGIRDIPKPVPKANELLVKVMAAGICGTDIHIMHDEYACKPPVVLGHEYTGVIEAMGKDVLGFKEGDQIISLTAAVTCGKCDYCNQGLLMLCDQRKSIGSGIDGAMAEYLVIPHHLAFKVPENYIGSDQLAISEPVACCIRAVIEFSSVRAGDVALISGPGTIGQLTLQLAKAQGAFTIMSGTPVDMQRLELAKKMGADVTISDPSQLMDVVHQYAPGGVDVAYECAGAAPSLAACVKALKKRGNLSQIGLYGKPISFDMDTILYKELVHTATFASERTSWQILLKLLEQGKLNLEPFISARLPLDDWQKGFDMFLNKEGYKIFLKP
jgi:L-iditol 2-dehydrogenase